MIRDRIRSRNKMWIVLFFLFFFFSIVLNVTLIWKNIKLLKKCSEAHEVGLEERLQELFDQKIKVCVFYDEFEFCSLKNGDIIIKRLKNERQRGVL